MYTLINLNQGQRRIAMANVFSLGKSMSPSGLLHISATPADPLNRLGLHHNSIDGGHPAGAKGENCQA